jgi:hypothetical protein
MMMTEREESSGLKTMREIQDPIWSNYGRTKLFPRVLAMAILSLALTACLTPPATLDSVDKAYKTKDTGYLGRVRSGSVQATDAATRQLAEKRLTELMQTQLAADLEAAKKRGDAGYLERFAKSTSDPFASDALKMRA